MRINLLGSFELQDERGRTLPPPGPKRRALLAALALEFGRVVPVERLLDLLWDGAPSSTARSALRGHVTAVRRLLAAAADGIPVGGPVAEDPDGLHVVTRGAGYALLGDPEAVDVQRFERLRAAGEETGAETADRLRRALDLWRGPALDGCGSGRLAAEAGPRLTAARRDTVERLAALLLAEADGSGGVEGSVEGSAGGFVDRLGEVTADLAELAAAEPARESAAALLVRCRTVLAGLLAAAGRGYDAIAVLELVVAAHEARGDAPLTARALDDLAHCLYQVGEAERGLAVTERALDLIHAHPDDPLQGDLRFGRAEALRVLGRVEEALAALTEVLAVAEEQGNARLVLLALDFHGAVLAELGRPEEAADSRRRALDLREAVNSGAA
ncbi:tetratricopeptide repeat protein [Kitasatospora sp. NPDC093806]|uniref:tetratricopeptide repeat protein n=1 Tax=Kitasatospora sp. NPDC093806 TaxID=3155075 RepID=UPI003439E346